MGVIATDRRASDEVNRDEVKLWVGEGGFERGMLKKPTGAPGSAGHSPHVAGAAAAKLSDNSRLRLHDKPAQPTLREEDGAEDTDDETGGCADATYAAAETVASADASASRSRGADVGGRKSRARAGVPTGRDDFARDDGGIFAHRRASLLGGGSRHGRHLGHHGCSSTVLRAGATPGGAAAARALHLDGVPTARADVCIQKQSSWHFGSRSRAREALELRFWVSTPSLPLRVRVLRG